MSHLEEAPRKGRQIRSDEGLVVAHVHPKPATSHDRTQWVAVLTKSGAHEWDHHSLGSHGARGAIKDFANAQGTSVHVEYEGREVSKIYPDADRWAPVGGALHEGGSLADFDNLEALIEHARGEGATHVLVAPGDTRLYFPTDGGYREAKAKQMDGYWHIPAPNWRPIVASLPTEKVEPIENFQFYRQPGRRREGAALHRAGVMRRGVVREASAGTNELKSSVRWVPDVDGGLVSAESLPVAAARSLVASLERDGHEASWASDHDDRSRAWVYATSIPEGRRGVVRKASEAGWQPGGHRIMMESLVGQWAVGGDVADKIDYGRVTRDSRSTDGKVDIAWKWSGTKETLKPTYNKVTFYSSEDMARREAEARVKVMSPGPSFSNRHVREERNDRLFIGVFPAGISYADKSREKHGDYARCGSLSFDTLELTIERDCPAALRKEIETHAAKIQARRGESYPTSSSGHTVILGGRAVREQEDEALFDRPDSIKRFIDRELAKHGDVVRDHFRTAADDAAKMAKKYEADARLSKGGLEGKRAAAAASAIRKSEAMLRKAAQGGVRETPKKKTKRGKR